jgi:glutamate dehydrogenase/leucine dehydrogenase
MAPIVVGIFAASTIAFAFTLEAFSSLITCPVAAGGVIASMEEYSRSLSAIKLQKADVFRIITDKISDNMSLSMQLAKDKKITLSEAATEIAMERVLKVMQSRRYI